MERSFFKIKGLNCDKAFFFSWDTLFRWFASLEEVILFKFYFHCKSGKNYICSNTECSRPHWACSKTFTNTQPNPGLLFFCWWLVSYVHPFLQPCLKIIFTNSDQIHLLSFSRHFSLRFILQSLVINPGLQKEYWLSLYFCSWSCFYQSGITSLKLYCQIHMKILKDIWSMQKTWFRIELFGGETGLYLKIKAMHLLHSLEPAILLHSSYWYLNNYTVLSAYWICCFSVVLFFFCKN